MLTLKDIEERLGRETAPVIFGDHTLNPELRPCATLRRAAVLILLVEKDERIHVLFTERGAHLSAHPGQISFPGGGEEEGDESPVKTALREAEEEIGLRAENVRVLGAMTDYITRSGFHVTPVVAVLEKQQLWTPNDDEVARIFEVPLDHIIEHLHPESLTFEDRPRHFYAVEWLEFRIWGATAGMLKNFVNALSARCGPANDAVPESRAKDDTGGL